MKKLFITVGLPGSGKSSLIQDGTVMLEPYLYEYAHHLSSDNIREELWGDRHHQEDHSLVFEQMFSRTMAHLKAGNNVYYDATNLSRKRRMSLIKSVRDQIKEVEVVALFLATPLEECFRRDAHRPGLPVGRETILRMAKMFNLPVVEEGFDQIHFIPSGRTKELSYKKHYDSAQQFLKSFLVESMGVKNISNDYDQNSTYHTKLLHEHLYLAFEGAKSDIVKIAAGLHDIGKPLCQDVHKSGRSTYYQHDCLGSYMAAVIVAHLDIEDEQLSEEIFLVPQLIGHHMLAHKIFSSECNPKTYEKYLNMYGEEYLSLLKELQIADANAK